MEQLFISTKIKSSLSVEPKDLNSNLNKKIIKKIRLDVEGKCIKNGYVRKNSVKLVKRSLGQSLTSHFNGNVLFHVEYLVDLCNPLEGATIDCSVINSNKMGVLAEILGVEDSPLNILLAKQHHIDNLEFEDLRERDIIKIRVLGKRYEFGDSQITIIGLLESEYQKQYDETLVENDEEEPLDVMSNDNSQPQSSFSFESNSNTSMFGNPSAEVLGNQANNNGLEEINQELGASVAAEGDAEAKSTIEGEVATDAKVAEGKNELDLDFELKPFTL